jgi:hypothetical protein
MSKILFVTQKLTPNSLNQIEIIKRSGHEFTVITSQSEKNVGLNHPDVLYYFSKWNFIELARFLPSFMIINPDIVHVFVDSKSSVKTADFFSGLAQLFRKLFSVQFFLSEDSFLKTNRAKKLVYSADIVTGPHRTFLYHMRGLKARNRYQIKGVIPPILRLTESSVAADVNTSDKNDFGSYEILMPLKIEHINEQVILDIAKRFSVLFSVDSKTWTSADIKKLNYALQRQGSKPWRFFPLGENGQDLKSLPSAGLTLWLAGLEFELEECIQYFEFSLNRKMKIVMDHSQMRLYPDLWENNPMAQVTQKRNVLNYITHFSLSSDNEPVTDYLNTVSLVDISVNEFNRLISKATNTQNEKAV